MEIIGLTESLMAVGGMATYILLIVAMAVFVGVTLSTFFRAWGQLRR